MKEQFTSVLKIHYLFPRIVLEAKSRQAEGEQIFKTDLVEKVRYVQEEQAET